MKSNTINGIGPVDSTGQRSNQLLSDQQQRIYRQTDRMFAALMILQWLGGVVAALFISPSTWIGQTSQVHLHVWAAVILGGIISFLPVTFALLRPGSQITRYTIAVGQMLMSSLLIHLTGGRIETHFHVFGSLAFLSFYRDWRVLIPASIVVAADHLVRGLYYPQSVFGVLTAENWRWLEHGAWVAFEDVFLIIACLRGQREMRQIAENTAQLDASEARYRAVTNSASDAIITIDKTGRILFVNRAAEKIFGYRDDELIGENLSILTTEDIPPGPAAESPDILPLSTYAPILDITASRKDGSKFPIEISFGEFDKDGNRLFTAVIRDVTERKRTEEALRKSEEYRNLFKHANDAIIIFEPENETVLDVNDWACEVYGRSRDEFIGLSLKTISLNSDDNRRRHLDRLLAEGHLPSFESIHFHRDGTPIHFLISASQIEFEGRPAILSIHCDITSRVKASEALSESESKFRTLVENMSEGLLEMDNQDNITFTNERFCEMTGYSADELLGKNASDLLLDEESREIVKQANARRLDGLSESYELKLRTKAGDTLWSLMGAVPIFDSYGNIVGSMGVHTDITERKRAEEQLLFNAMHDTLTGLPNRALLLEHLRNAIDRSARYKERPFAVLFLDFDRFKVINDSLGHMEGDKLLVMIARCLEKALRSGDIVARLGGDEFTILLDNLTGMDEIIHVVRRVQDSLRLPFRLGEREVFISTSIGIAVSKPEYSKPEEILRDADIAMYRAKTKGRSQYEVFNEEMHRQADYRLQLETELRRAIERREFRVYYQPIVELENDAIVGFEALIRWVHPKRGLVSPLDFIPLAEETGLIVPIGDWVLSESCRQVREWQLRNPANSELTISVNLSSKQFLQEDLPGRVAAMLAETGLNARHLRLEVTESHVMESDQKAIEIMNGLRQLGIKLSIDDFGTGYSNLSYLHRMPINYLKIDRSFVSRMQTNYENTEIVRTIVMLAKNLGFEVIAEGVETQEQARHLKMLNCTFGQGYLFSKPLESGRVEELLEKMPPEKRVDTGAILGLGSID